MTDERSLYNARPNDLSALNDAWAAAKAGEPRVLRLQAPFGGGRRALTSHWLQQRGEDEAVVWRVPCLEQENGLQWLVRMYGTLVGTLTQSELLRGKVEMMLNSQLPNQPARVQAWYQQFNATLKESSADENGQMQLRMPQDNPLLALIEIASAICRKAPLIVELQQPYVVHSMALARFVESLRDEVKASGGNLFVILHDEPESDVSRAFYPRPLLEFFERRADAIDTHAIAPWTEEDAAQYLASRGLESDAARLAAISGGRPGFMAELVDILAERDELGADLAETTFSTLVPTSVDEGELEVPDTAPEDSKRIYADHSQVGRVAFLAALLGSAFPSTLLADMGGFDRDSVDDLLDALGDLFEEVQYSDEMGTWIYRFKRGCWREGVMEMNDSDEGREVARRVGMFMERFLARRGTAFLSKTARIYAEHGIPERAVNIAAGALSNDAPDVWGLVYDLTKYFDEADYPDAMMRTVYRNLLDRTAGGGNLQTADKLHTEATEWASAKEDREMTAWLLLNGSKLDVRRQDLFRARDRANDALALYEALESKPRMADALLQMATIELQDGNPSTAIEKVAQAEEVAKFEVEEGKTAVSHTVAAPAAQIRGLAARRTNKLDDAAKFFDQANQIAGQAGMPALALDSGLSYGEVLLAQRQLKPARDALARVLQIARSLRNPQRERQACELLAQAEGGLGNHDKALPLAARTLELSQALKLEQSLPIDFYNVGFFHLLNKAPVEALTFFKSAEERVGQLGKHPLVKELYYYKGVAHLQAGQSADAKTSLTKGLDLLQDAKDWKKACSTLEHLSDLEKNDGNADAAKAHLTNALQVAQQANLRDQRKSIKKKLDAFA